MISFLKLIRYKNLLMIALTMLLTKYALIENYLSSHNTSHFEFIILIVSVLLIASGGYIVNDILDLKADGINKPDKVIVSRSISIKCAWIFYSLLSIIGLTHGIGLAYRIEQPTLSFYFLGAVIALLLYSIFLKRIAFIGNIVVSLLVPLVILLTVLFDEIVITKSDIISSLVLSIVLTYYLIFAFLSTFIRELIKDIEDIKGDHALRMKTLPIILGTKRTRTVALVFTTLFLLFLFLVLKELIYEERYLFVLYTTFLIILSLNFASKLWVAIQKEHFSYLSRALKLIMFLGILSMLLFII